jgi:hypothetical protein
VDIRSLRPASERRKTRMQKNIDYNLIEMSMLSKSLHRYDVYMKHAQECPTCREIWTQFAEQRQKELSILLKELKTHMHAGRVRFE